MSGTVKWATHCCSWSPDWPSVNLTGPVQTGPAAPCCGWITRTWVLPAGLPELEQSQNPEWAIWVCVSVCACMWVCACVLKDLIWLHHLNQKRKRKPHIEQNLWNINDNFLFIFSWRLKLSCRFFTTTDFDADILSQDKVDKLQGVCISCVLCGAKMLLSWLGLLDL